MDRRTGEQLYIQPEPAKGESRLRWNWDAPIIVSPAQSQRGSISRRTACFAATTGATRGRLVSPDLTRQLDREQAEGHGKDLAARRGRQERVDVVLRKHRLARRVAEEGRADLRRNRRRLDPGDRGRRRELAEDREVPGRAGLSYVSRVDGLVATTTATVYAAFDNHKMGDFKPYLLASHDRGATWTSIAARPARARHRVRDRRGPGRREPALLPERSSDSSSRRTREATGIQLKGGLPTIAVKDIAIQTRENDLVIATFGRGFYILDDYSPLRTASGASRSFATRSAKVFIPASPLGLKGKAFQGDGFYEASNPPFGAVLTYSLKDGEKTLAEKRRDAEKEAEKAGKTPGYPTLAELRAEDAEADPEVLATITDASGNVVRRLTGPAKSGIHRVAWDLRYPPSDPASLKPPKDEPFSSVPEGPLVVPGRYTASFATVVNGKTTSFGDPQSFDVGGLFEIPSADREKLLEFEKKTARLQRAVLGSEQLLSETEEQLKLIEKALLDTPGADADLMAQARALEGTPPGAGARDLGRCGRGETQRERPALDLRPGRLHRRNAVERDDGAHAVEPGRVSRRGLGIRNATGEIEATRRGRPGRARIPNGENRRAVDSGPRSGVEEGIGGAYQAPSGTISTGQRAPSRI